MKKLYTIDYVFNDNGRESWLILEFKTEAKSYREALNLLYNDSKFKSFSETKIKKHVWRKIK